MKKSNKHLNTLVGSVMKYPNKYLENLYNDICNDFDEKDIVKKVMNDGIELFCLRMLFGYMSSSSTLKRVLVNRYGYDDILNDLLFIYEGDERDNKPTSNRLEIMYQGYYPKKPRSKKHTKTHREES